MSEEWAPITRAVTDAAEVSSEWLGAHRAEVRVVDVREREDFNDEMGHIPVMSHPFPVRACSERNDLLIVGAAGR
jgi:hypothetical protein